MIGLRMEDPMMPISVIWNTKGRWEKQCEATKDAKYLEDLILRDLVSKIKSYKLTYDYLLDTIDKAKFQQKEKYKRDRKDFHNIEAMLISDFFNNDKRFKLKSIISGGYEGYYNSFEFTCQANEGEAIPDCSIQIPVKKILDSENIQTASWGQIVFCIKEKEYVHCVKHKCYDIESMAKYITDYFNLKVEDK